MKIFFLKLKLPIDTQPLVIIMRQRHGVRLVFQGIEEGYYTFKQSGNIEHYL